MTASTNSAIHRWEPAFIIWLLTLSLVTPARLPAGALQQGTPSTGGSRSHAPVGSAAIWHPGTAALKAIRSDCSQPDPEFGPCFIKGMQENGASPSAIAFARSLQADGKSGVGYMKDLTEGGHVAVAQVVFPRPQGSREAWLLVNGSPSPIDVDDLSLLPMTDVRSDMVFREIRRTFTKVGVYSEPRSEPSPALIPRAAEAQEFLVNYALLNACGTCKRVGTAQFAFDFEGNGKFEGVSLRGVWMTPDQGTLAPVSMVKDFHFHLVADHAAGYRWQLASPLDERFVSLVSTTYSTPNGKAGIPGVEDWVFHPRAPGRTIIRFQKVHPGEKIVPRERRFFFVVTIQ